MLKEATAFLKRKESFSQGFVVSTVLSMLSKVLGFVSTILMAFFFGSSKETDVFFFATGTMALLSGFFVNINSTKIIPEYMRLRESGDGKRANDLLGVFFFAFFCIAGAIAVGVFAFPKAWMNLFSQFDSATIASNIGIIQWSGLFIIFTVLNNLLIDVLNSFGRFSFSILSGFANSTVTIISMVLLHNALGVQSVVLGGLIGSFFQGTLLFIFVSALSGCRFIPRSFPVDRAFFRYVLLAQGSYVCSLFGVFFPLYLLTGLSSGTVSALGYGQRLIDILTFVLVSQFSSVIAIKLNDLQIKRKFDTDPDFFTQTGKAAMFLAIPIVTVVCVLSVECITVLFMRGKFHEASTMEAAGFARIFVFLIPLLIINTMVARLVQAAQIVDKSFAYQSTIGILGGLACFVGIRCFGATGYPWAQLVVYTVNLVAVKFLLDRWLPWLRGYYRMLLYGLAILAVNGLIVPVDIVVRNTVSGRPPAGVIAIVAPIHIIMFGAIAYVLRLHRQVRGPIEGILGQRIARLFQKT